MSSGPGEIEEHDVDTLVGEADERLVAHADRREREGGQARWNGGRERRAQQARRRRVAGDQQCSDRLEIHVLPREYGKAEKAPQVPVRNDGGARAGVTRCCRAVELRASFGDGPTAHCPHDRRLRLGGGAGIQADLKTFHHFRVFGTSVITAVTAQNTRGVQGWVAVPVSMIEAQIDAVAGDLRPAAAKTGMLADSAIVEAVAAAIRRHALAPLVVDPVMVSASGDALLERRRRRDARAAHPARDARDAESRRGRDARGRRPCAMSRRWSARGACSCARGATAALIKGGHLVGDAAIDVLVHGDRVSVFTHPRLDTRHTHGTGCTLSSAITALLARGTELDSAVEQSIDWVHRAIATAPAIGGGHGPLNSGPIKFSYCCVPRKFPPKKRGFGMF